MRKLFRLLPYAAVVAVAVAVALLSSAHDPVARGEPRVPETGPLWAFPPGPGADALAEGRRAAPASISLTASDGTGLSLASFDARGLVEGPLAFTELRLGFDNPEGRTLEGTFRITLPQGAAISRFAMRLGDRWQEGEVVEKGAARRAYEDFLHRRQDPALLEQAAGNEFSARVFPIPPGARKELVVSYSQEIGPAAPYAVALRGLPAVGKLDAVVSRTGDDAPLLGQIHLENRRPDRDLVVPPASLRAGEGLRAGELALFRVLPAPDAGPDPLGSAIVLVDTSASRALGFEAQIELVGQLAARIDPATPILVAAFDQGVDALYEGPASGFAAAGPAALRARQALGASDLASALAWAGSRAPAAKATRVVLVGDGVPTVGPTEPQALADAARQLAAAGVTRLDALAVGGIRDDALLRRLAGALPRKGMVIDGTRGVENAYRRLSSTARSVPVRVEEARWQWPLVLEGVQPGDEALVYAEIPEGTAARVRVGDAPVREATLAPVDRPLLERAWAQARIAQLSAAPEADARARAEIVRLSTTYRVLSPLTALLVLETEADYARYKIDRRALADVLTLDGTRLARLKRGADPLVAGATAAVTAPPADGIVLRAPPAPPALPAASAEREASSGLAAAMAGSLRSEMAPAAEVPRAAMASGAASRAVALDEASQFGMIGYLDAGALRSRGLLAPPTPAVRPYTGALAAVMEALARRDRDGALTGALAAWRESPGDVMALVGLGEAFEARGEVRSAARAYGSIIDLFSSRADLRRMAGERLERLAAPHALSLAADSYEKAVQQRPDHPAGHRLLAYARLRSGDAAGAFAALEGAARRTWASGRFPGVDQILREDLGLVAAAWIKAEPGKREAIERRLRDAGASLPTTASVRFVLVWETDNNDVDFHIHDARGGHAFFGAKELPSGGSLYADVTTGYGPECFTVPLPAGRRAGPYRLQAHYYSRGPMGYGMGKLEIVDHDGKGGLTFEERPFVVMADGAYVELGSYPAARQ